MKLTRIALPAFLLLAMTACDDDTSVIGSSLSKGEVVITIDSITHAVEAWPEYRPEYDSRSSSTLLGRLSVDSYGDLRCSFVAQLLPSTSLGIPDSIMANRVDSLRMMVRVARGGFTGDSLAPQQLKVYALTKQLPSDLTNKFDPTGYYDPESPLGVRTYTLTALSKTDSSFYKDKYIDIPVKLPDSYASRIFVAYHTKPSLFAWPSTFAQSYPGIYVEQTFGRGCVANLASVNFYLYYHYPYQEPYTEDGTVNYRIVTKRDSVSLLTIAPEVTSANCITYRPGAEIERLAGEKKALITTPGGYVTRMKFPADEIIADYRSHDSSLGIVSRLSFEIPAQQVTNSHGIGIPTTLLMVKTSELASFFNENRIPDDKTSFWARYNSTTGRYSFTGMRDYILSLMESGQTPSESDMDFTLVPVAITTEEETNLYTQEVTTYVTRCAPYMQKPSMAILDTDHSVIVFTYSTQTMK